jgi:hypothetical protein
MHFENQSRVWVSLNIFSSGKTVNIVGQKAQVFGRIDVQEFHVRGHSAQLLADKREKFTLSN